MFLIRDQTTFKISDITFEVSCQSKKLQIFTHKILQNQTIPKLCTLEVEIFNLFISITITLPALWTLLFWNCTTKSLWVQDQTQ